MAKRRGRVYWRDRGGVRRAYGDFRDYADVGGGREALVAKGEKMATGDGDVADRLAAERVAELERYRRNRALLGMVGTTLEDFAAEHMLAKARSRRFTRRHLLEVEARLRSAIEFLGGDRALDSINVDDVERWLAMLAERPNGKGGTLSDATRRHYLNALSNLFRRAIAEKRVPAGHNPAAAVQDKPACSTGGEAPWLGHHEAALLIEAARTYRPKRPDMATPGVHAIVATMLLTGGRKREVLGLDVEDVSFDRRTVIFRPNRWRSLKTATSRRVVPLWPQLEAILRAHVFERDDPHPGGLLFPGRDGRMIGDLDKALDEIAARCGWDPGAIRSKMFRHTYCAGRLQSLDRGAPVSPFTVSREMGHGGLRLVERVYGHLGDVRHRSEVVEYLVEQHADALGERLRALQATT